MVAVFIYFNYFMIHQQKLKLRNVYFRLSQMNCPYISHFHVLTTHLCSAAQLVPSQNHIRILP